VDVLEAPVQEVEDIQLSQFGFEDLSLLDGEQVEISLDLTDGSPEATDPEVLVLTDRRLLHLGGNRRNRMVSIAAVPDIGIMQMTNEKEGAGPFIWAALAFFVGIMLWQVVDHAIGGPAAGIVLFLMGLYLIYDRLTSPGKNIIVFKSGVGEIRVEVRNEDVWTEIDGLTHRLFRLKDEGAASRRYVNTCRFAMR
jgi:hypothetical protein